MPARRRDRRTQAGRAPCPTTTPSQPVAAFPAVRRPHPDAAVAEHRDRRHRRLQLADRLPTGRSGGCLPFGGDRCGSSASAIRPVLNDVRSPVFTRRNFTVTGKQAARTAARMDASERVEASQWRGQRMRSDLAGRAKAEVQVDVVDVHPADQGRHGVPDYHRVAAVLQYRRHLRRGTRALLGSWRRSRSRVGRALSRPQTGSAPYLRQELAERRAVTPWAIGAKHHGDDTSSCPITQAIPCPAVKRFVAPVPRWRGLVAPKPVPIGARRSSRLSVHIAGLGRSSRGHLPRTPR